MLRKFVGFFSTLISVKSIFDREDFSNFKTFTEFENSLKDIPVSSTLKKDEQLKKCI